MSPPRRRPLRHSPLQAGKWWRRAVPLLAGLSLAAAQDDITDDDGGRDPLAADTTSGFLAGSLLPDGSILKDVVMPSYDEKLRLTGTLRAKELVIVNRRLIDAKELEIRFFNPDESLRGYIAMSKARYNDRRDLLRSRDPVSLESSDLTARGSGIDFDVARNRGILHGPVPAEFNANLSTTMHTPPTRRGFAAGAMLMASTLAVPAEPLDPEVAARREAMLLDAARLEQIAEDAAPAGERLAAEGEAAGRAIAEAGQASSAADTALNAFLQAAALKTLLAEEAPAASGGDVPAPEVAPDPLRTRITSDGGAFFDPPSGLLLFLKNIVVRDPRIDLTASEELKVFFDPKPEEEDKAEEAAAEEDKKDALISGAKFGNPTRIVATGVVVIDYKPEDPNDPRIKASARTVIYNLKDEEIILRGGSPWIIRDGEPVRVLGNDAYIRVARDGTFITGGGKLDTEINTQRKR